jgi:hypothetical protein
MRTVWDLLTDPALDARVTHPHRPSHAQVTLPSDWQISVTVSPGSASSLGKRFAVGLEQPISTLDAMGRDGSPEGWFDRAQHAEVAIMMPDGTWYWCQENDADYNPDHPQPWRYVDVDELALLLERVRAQPAGCLCPDCNAA